MRNRSSRAGARLPSIVSQSEGSHRVKPRHRAGFGEHTGRGAEPRPRAAGERDEPQAAFRLASHPAQGRRRAGPARGDAGARAGRGERSRRALPGRHESPRRGRASLAAAHGVHRRRCPDRPQLRTRLLVLPGAKRPPPSEGHPCLDQAEVNDVPATSATSHMKRSTGELTREAPRGRDAMTTAAPGCEASRRRAALPEEPPGS